MILAASLTNTDNALLVTIHVITYILLSLGQIQKDIQPKAEEQKQQVILSASLTNTDNALLVTINVITYILLSLGQIQKDIQSKAEEQKQQDNCQPLLQTQIMLC